MKIPVVGVMVLASALFACKLGEFEAAGNCNASAVEDKQFCFEYAKDEVASGQKVCSGWEGAKWSTGPCDKTNAHGSCETMSGIRKVFYKGTQFPTADAAKLQCSKKWKDGA